MVKERLASSRGKKECWSYESERGVCIIVVKERGLSYMLRIQNVFCHQRQRMLQRLPPKTCEYYRLRTVEIAKGTSKDCECYLP
jgi:hypothetical protein